MVAYGKKKKKSRITIRVEKKKTKCIHCYKSGYDFCKHFNLSYLYISGKKSKTGRNHKIKSQNSLNTKNIQDKKFDPIPPNRNQMVAPEWQDS